MLEASQVGDTRVILQHECLVQVEAADNGQTQFNRARKEAVYTLPLKNIRTLVPRRTVFVSRGRKMRIDASTFVQFWLTRAVE